MLFYGMAVLCVLFVWAMIWQCRLWVRRSVRRDMAAWDAQWAEEDTRIREEDDRFWQAIRREG